MHHRERLGHAEVVVERGGERGRHRAVVRRFRARPGRGQVPSRGRMGSQVLWPALSGGRVRPGGCAPTSSFARTKPSIRWYAATASASASGEYSIADR